MKPITALLLIILIIILAQLYFIFQDNRRLGSELKNLNARAETLSVDNDKVKSEIEYYSHPENIEKELRSRFNYKKPGEKMMIIVP